MNIRELNKRFNKKTAFLGVISITSLGFAYLADTTFHYPHWGKMFLAITMISVTTVPWLILYTSLRYRVLISSVGKKVCFKTFWQVTFDQKNENEKVVNPLFVFYFTLGTILLLPTIIFLQSLFKKPTPKELAYPIQAKYCDNAWSKFSKNISQENYTFNEECFLVNENEIAITVNSKVIFYSDDQEDLKKVETVINKAKQKLLNTEVRNKIESWSQLPISGGIPQTLYLYDKKTTLVLKSNEVPEDINVFLIEIIEELKTIIRNL